MPFVFPPGEDCDQLIARLQGGGWWGEITGGHGTGKSALLAVLLPAIEDAGQRPLLVELHDGQRRLPRDVWSSLRRQNPSLVVVDGYEQLSYWSRFRLKRLCRSESFGLLVTSHATVGLRPIYQTAMTIATAEQIVQRFLAGRQPLFTSEELRDLFQKHQGNLREMLFDLYDFCEQRQVAAVSKPGTLRSASNS